MARKVRLPELICLKIDGETHIVEAERRKGPMHTTCPVRRTIGPGDLASFILARPTCHDCIEGAIEQANS